MRLRPLFVAWIALGLGAAWIDRPRPFDLATVIADIETERDYVSAEHLAAAIVAGHQVQVLDLRGDRSFAGFHIPTATPVDFATLTTLDAPHDTAIVLYSDEVPRMAQAWTLLRLRGYRKVRFLREGVYEWIARIDEPKLAIDATAEERVDFERRAELSRFFGGRPRVDVPRSEMPQGYWTRAGSNAALATTTAPATKTSMGRRGC